MSSRHTDASKGRAYKPQHEVRQQPALATDDIDIEIDTTGLVPEGAAEPAPVVPLTEDYKRHKEKIHKHHRAHKRKKRLAVVGVIVGILALVAAACGVAAWTLVSSGDSAMHVEGSGITTPDDASSDDEGETVVYKGHTYKLNENIVSVAALGYDKDKVSDTGQAGGQADAIIVFAMDTATGKVTAISVPRDSMVDVGEYVGEAYVGQDQMQVCLAFSYGDGTKQGAEYTTTAVSRMLYNMPIKYYFALDLDGVPALNDSIGGVSLTPLETIPGTEITEGQRIVLHGENATSYVRWRDTTKLSSSTDRQKRQVQYLRAFSKQALEKAKDDVGVLKRIYNGLSKYSVTNLGSSEVAYLLSNVVNNGVKSVEMKTLSGTIKQNGQYAEIYLDEDKLYKTVLDVYYTQID